MMFFDWFMLGLRISCAVSVVMHVLLTRREPSTAIGWIGITVLMPFTGFVLYLMFGVNRVRRLAQRLTRNMSWGGGVPKTRWQYTVSGPMMPLAHMMGQLTERHVVDGNKVDILHDGDQAYPLMLETIASARTSVFLCSYIFRGDGIGMQFVDALVAAHARGVEVRVITDGIGGGYFLAPACKALRRHGVPVGRFMHSLLPWRMPFINLRNHRKILIVDGNIGFMGGINIGDENLVKKQPPYPVSDTHFRLGGPIIRQLTEAFTRDWAFVTGENLAGPEYFPEIDAAGKIPMRIVTAGPDSDLEKIEFAMLQALALSRSSVSLMTPYFLPGARLRTELSLAAIRGVKVDIVLPLVSNHRLIDLASREDISLLIQAGCRVWYAPPPFNHSKLMSVDGLWAFVGSSNLDIRSLRLNFEINLEVYDQDFAVEIDSVIMAHAGKRVTHYDLDRRSLPIRLRDAAIRLGSPYL